MRREVHLLIAISALAFLAGCGAQQDPSGLTREQQSAAQDLNAWAKASDGDWSRLTGEQRATLIKNLGSESSAKAILQMKAHPPKPIAPGPPPGWKPGAPPPSTPTAPQSSP